MAPLPHTPPAKRYHRLPPDQARGCLLAHALRLPPHGERPAVNLPKGTQLAAEHADGLIARGVEEVAVIRPEPGDLGEDAAVQRLLPGLAHPSLEWRPAHGGRINAYARQPGVLLIDAAAVHRLNRHSEALGLATLPPERLVAAQTLVASLKVVPFVVPGAVIDAVQADLQGRSEASGLGPRPPILRVAKFIPRPVALFQTQLAQTKDSVLAKTEAVMRQRLARLGCQDLSCQRLPHQDAALRQALAACAAPLVLLMGASAVCDRGDMIPSAIEAVGGQIEHFGMPVDPGNLLVLARRPLPGSPDQRLIILPGCARSPQDNGTDLVLQRELSQAPLDGDFLMGLGVGGLLKESAERGQAREA